MRTWALLLGLGACNQVLGVHDFDPVIDAPADVAIDTLPLLPECPAQRVVHLVAGTGGFAWFTIAWPLPAVIEGFHQPYAYDDPTFALSVGTETDHPLYARRDGQSAIWVARGKHPQASAFVAGLNETHTNNPTSSSAPAGTSIDAVAGALQRDLHPIYAAIVIGDLSYGTAPNAPTPVAIPNPDGGPGLFTDTAVQTEVTVSATQLARYVPATASLPETALAKGLAFAANTFKYGLVGTVMIPAYRDDPHGAFSSNLVTGHGDDLARMLDAFYADLEPAFEIGCGDHEGHPLSVADNTVFIVTGDTPKDSFNSNSWGDGTIDSSNYLYFRSNGYTRPGWFGKNDGASRTNFDPTTGALSATASPAMSTAAAWAGMLFAIARGNRAVVSTVTSAPYDGVLVMNAP